MPPWTKRRPVVAAIALIVIGTIARIVGHSFAIAIVTTILFSLAGLLLLCFLFLLVGESEDRERERSGRHEPEA